MDKRAQPPESRGGTVERLIIALVAIGPPALTGGALWPTVRSKPLLSFVTLVVYWLALIGLRFAGRVGGVLSDRWVPKVADAVDRAVSATVGGYRSKYEDQLAESVRDVEMMGIPTQSEFALRLRQVYVDVSLLPQPLQETAHEPFVGRLPPLNERRTLQSFLGGKEPRVFAVIGGPGSGKTTLLRHTALSLCRGGFRRRSLPVLLYLRDHIEAIVEQPELRLAEAAASVRWLKEKVVPGWLEQRLESGRCLVMLDGLDEVAVEADRQKVVAWVKLQIERYPGNDYVLTSRPYGYLSNPLGNADVLQVRRFTAGQISDFVHAWYYAIECRSSGEEGEHTRSRSTEKADGLLRRLRHQSALYDLAANPLLLTMIANVHKYRGALPGSRAALYGEMCEVLLHRRQEAKGLAVGTGLRSEQKERVVRKLAVAMMTRRIRDISAKDARLAIGPALRSVAHNVDPAQFLSEVGNSGLLVERELGRYGFAHLTLQEYLAAVEGRELRATDLLTAWVDDPWWRETILLWAAGADASPVIEACLDAGSVRALALAIDCADEAREVSPPVRAELQALLDSAANKGMDDERRRLITGARVAQTLRDVVWLSGATAVCAHPISQEIYSLFRQEEGRQQQETPAADGSAEAVGMGATDSAHFVEWVNRLYDDGTVHRLPSRAELQDPAIDLVVDLTRNSVWEMGDPRPRLHCSSDVRHPYLATTDELARSFAADTKQTSAVALSCLALALERDEAHALQRHLRLSSMNLVDVIEELYGMRRYDLARLEDDGAIESRRERAGSRYAFREPVDTARTRAFKRALGGSGSDSNVRIGRALQLSRIAHRMGSRFDDETSDHVRSLSSSLTEADDLRAALEASLDGTIERALDNDRSIELARAFKKQEADWDGLTGEQPTATAFRILVLSYAILLDRWAEVDKPKSGPALDAFHAFQLKQVPVPSHQQAILPEEVAELLTDALTHLQSRQADDTPSGRKCVLAQQLLRDVQELLPPSLQAGTPLSAELMSAVRLGLLGTLVAADQIPRMEAVGDLLRRVICCLTALEGRVRGDIMPTELILLVPA